MSKPLKPAKKVTKIKPVRKIRKKRKKRVITKDDVTTSKEELLFMAFLMAIGVPVESQFQIGKKFYDFKVVGKDILIEFDGDYWHCNPAVYKEGPVDNKQRKGIANDIYKNGLAARAGFHMIRVWERDFKHSKNDVKERILKEIEGYKK